MSLKDIKLKQFGIGIGIVFVCLYSIFLCIPFGMIHLIDTFTDDIEKTATEITGLEVKIDKLRAYTTPLLAIGIKADNLTVKTPDKDDTVLDLKKAGIDVKLLPLIFKKVQLGKITAEDVNVNLSVKQGGDFEVFDYIPENKEEQDQMTSLPFGLKLSNNLPDIKIKDYNISFKNAENEKIYSIIGNNLKITDFQLDKRIKIKTTGKVVFDNTTVSNFDIKIINLIMPNLQLDDLVFPKEVKTEKNSVAKQNDTFKIDIIDIFDGIKRNRLHADLKADIRTYGTFKNPVQKGSFAVNNMTIAVDNELLPESYFKILFKGKTSDIDAQFYTSSDKTEITKLHGYIKTDKKANIDLNFVSNAKFNNIIRLIDSIAQSFGVNDFKTISATGGINADFNLKSDLKTINSNGYLKIADSSIKYGLYNIFIDKIRANVDLKNNNITIKDTGLSVMGHPLNLTGTISSEADADLNLTADNLSLKSLLLTTGQLALLKENDINSGTLSLNALIKGKLATIKPDITLNLNNVSLYNKPANTKCSLKNALIKILYNANKLSGNIDVYSLGINFDGTFITVPKAKIVADTKDIKISDSSVLMNNSKIDVKGLVKDYLTDELNMDIIANGYLSGGDIISFVPKELRSMFPYKGSMPVKILATGGSKSQNIAFDLSATPSGYVSFLNIDKLRGKTTKIHSDLKLKDNNIKLENSALYAGNKQIAGFNGEILDIFNPRLNINLSVPENISFTIPGLNEHSNISVRGDVNITGNITEPKLKGKAYIDDISVKDLDFALTNLIGNFNGHGICGNAAADKMKFGGIIGTNLSADFSLKNFTDFYLENIVGDAFSGKVKGKLSYNIPKFAFYTELTAKGLNSTDAVYGATGIQKALTGIMDFNTKLTGKGVTDKEIIKSLKGTLNFNINDGRFISIGKFENLVAAQNITSNSILKSAISALTTASALQETDKFNSISGEMVLSDGAADLQRIFVSGPLMSYYVKGKYYILPNTADLIILGRLDSKIISYLGPLGQLSAQKLVSYIPGIGQATAKMLELLTQDPQNEKTELIPDLSSGSKDYRDFKTIFNGSVEKASSVKSFKWLSVCDTTQIDLKQEGKNALQAAKDNINGQIESVKTTTQNMKNNIDTIVDTQKQIIETQKQSVEQAKTDLKNIKQNAVQSASNLGNLLKNAAQNSNKKFEIKNETSEGTNKTTQSKEEVSGESNSNSETIDNKGESKSEISD